MLVPDAVGLPRRRRRPGPRVCPTRRGNLPRGGNLRIEPRVSPCSTPGRGTQTRGMSGWGRDGRAGNPGAFGVTWRGVRPGRHPRPGDRLKPVVLPVNTAAWCNPCVTPGRLFAPRERLPFAALPARCSWQGSRGRPGKRAGDKDLRGRERNRSKGRGRAATNPYRGGTGFAKGWGRNRFKGRAATSSCVTPAAFGGATRRNISSAPLPSLLGFSARPLSADNAPPQRPSGTMAMFSRKCLLLCAAVLVPVAAVYLALTACPRRPQVGPDWTPARLRDEIEKGAAMPARRSPQRARKLPRGRTASGWGT
jgi:hypothetical protein